MARGNSRIISLQDAPDLPWLIAAEVALIADVTEGQLKGMLDRKAVVVANHNPGHGRARKFSSVDCVKVIVAAAMGSIGVPMRYFPAYAEFIAERARHVIAGLDNSTELLGRTTGPLRYFPRMWFLMMPHPRGRERWAGIEMGEEAYWRPDQLPYGYSVLQVDQLILDATRRLEAFANGNPLPERAAATALLRKLAKSYST